MVPKNDAEALNDYMDAYKKYNDTLDEYFPVSAVTLSQAIKPSKTITSEVLNELDRLAQDMETKRNLWMSFYRKQ